MEQQAQEDAPLIFDIEIDGKKVDIRFTRRNPDGVSQCELWGEINASGYRNHTFAEALTGDENEIVQAATDFAHQLRAEYLAAGGKTKKKGRKSKSVMIVATSSEEGRTDYKLVQRDTADADPLPAPVEAAAAEQETSSPDGDEEEEEEEADSHIETRCYDKYLRCNLTDEEWADASTILVQRMDDKKRKEDELSSIKEQFKGEISRIQADIDVNSQLVRDRYRCKDVRCHEIRNYEDETLTIARDDTGEVIESRRLRSHELQRILPGMA